MLDELRSRYPKSWAGAAARTLGAKADPDEIEARIVRDVHPALKLMLARWDELFADRLGERERAWALELLATRHAWAHLEAISIRDVLRILDAAELLLVALDAPEATGVKHLTADLTRRRRMRQTIASAMAGAAVALLAFLIALVWLDQDEVRALPSSLAGPWPGQRDSEMVFAANLTQRIPFDEGTIAVRGDILLVRTRLVVTPSWRRRAIYSFALPPRSGPFGFAQVRLERPKPWAVSGERALVTMAPSLRLRLVPGSTRLLDANGLELTSLPDPLEHADVLISGLDVRGIHYVESRLRVVAPASGTKGQIAGGSLECRGDRGRLLGPVSTPGNPVLCRVRLLNLGPRTLETVRLRLSGEPRGRTAVITATASAADAKPPKTDLFGAPVLRRGRVRALEYIPDSARLLTASDELIGTFRGNPFQRSLDVGELRVGEANSRSLEFSIRLR